MKVVINIICADDAGHWTAMLYHLRASLATSSVPGNDGANGGSLLTVIA
jgi:hypothetical protein